MKNDIDGVYVAHDFDYSHEASQIDDIVFQNLKAEQQLLMKEIYIRNANTAIDLCDEIEINQDKNHKLKEYIDFERLNN